MSPTDAAIDDGYFNDLSRQPSLNNGTDSPPERFNTGMNAEEGGALRPKRVACVICRKRKLKCDGGKPKCGTCARLGHCCAYDEVRRKSGPKRGYVKELEARLAQVETQLKTKAHKTQLPTKSIPQRKAPEPSVPSPLAFTPDNIGVDLNSQEVADGVFNPASNTQNISPGPSIMADINLGIDDTMSWEMIGLGLEEPLPMQEAIDDLHKIYFEKVHPSIPMIHQYRYMAAMSLAPHMRPAVCLRYAMWSLAAGASEKYFNHQEIFYRRARKYAELDDMKGQGEVTISINHVQCWSIISTYEFKTMCFPRAWTSVGKAVRLAQMMGLHRMDGAGLDVKQCLPPPRDWTEREQRRRTWWVVYTMDRYASVGTGWPMTIDEKDIMSNLPATDEAYNKSTPQETLSLDKVMSMNGAASISPFAGVVLIAHFFGCNLIHLQRPEADDREHDIQGGFWKRHRSMDNALLNTALNLPLHLRLPAGVRNPNTVFLNMNIHTSTICLHQAAIFKAEKNKMPGGLIEQSYDRCLLAASEITSIMRLVSHLDVSGMNPFMAFSLYIAARVFVHCLKKTPGEQEIAASLRFLLNAMSALKRTQPITESFLIQLNLDMQANGLGALLRNPEISPSLLMGMSKLPAENNFDRVKCSPLFDIGDSLQRSKPDPTFELFQSLDEEPIRPTQYSLQDFSIPTSESRQQPRSNLQYKHSTPPFPLMHRPSPPSQGWSSAQQAMDAFDTEMSDFASGGLSTGPTPSNSQPTASSATSHSSPSERDPNSTSHGASPPDSKNQPVLLFPNPTATQHTPPSDLSDFSPAEPPETQDGQQRQQQNPNDAFILAPDWRLKSTGETPAPSAAAAMTPLSESSWAQILEGMGWEGTALGGEGLAWTPGAESTR